MVRILATHSLLQHDQSFQIQGIIDSGTFGVVVKAFCIETKEQVAIKKVF